MSVSQTHLAVVVADADRQPNEGEIADALAQGDPVGSTS
jgi:hypothetical protein